MTQALKGRTKSIPTAVKLSEAWVPVYRMLGFGKVRTEKEYNRAIRIMDEIVDGVGDNKKHPMAALLDYLAEQVEDYETKSFPIPDAAPHKVLGFLLETHGLKQSDIPGIPQSMVSAILAGKRAISKSMAKTLAARFSVSSSVFL
jgi:HTH-type transcriptional regulator / antitoxin HigA